MNSATTKTGLPPSMPLRKAVLKDSTIRNRGLAQALGAILLGVAAISAASAQALYSVTDLGVLPGYASCVPSKINDLGDVVGACTPTVVDNYNGAAFVWRNGTMSAVGKLPKGTYSHATAINSLGAIIGVGDAGDPFRPQAWVTSPAGLQIFSTNSNINPVFIGDNGMIGGYYVKSGIFRGAIWTVDPKDPRKYRSTDLPLWPSVIQNSQFPTTFNQSGQAAGWGNSDQIRGTQAFFWNNDAAHSIVLLGAFPGDQGSQAYGMNDFGQVAGLSFTPDGFDRAVVWNNDAAHTVIELPPLPGDNHAIAGRITNTGHVLGASYYVPPGTLAVNAPNRAYRTVVWRDGGVFELQTALDPATGAAWTIHSLYGTNNLDQMVGVGVLNGQSHAVLLTPLPQ
jgi:uncharacterized membrane protein